MQQGERQGHTKGLCTLGPGVEVPLELHLAMWLHGVHDHLEGAVQLEVDLGVGQCMSAQVVHKTPGCWGCLHAPNNLGAHQHTPTSWRAVGLCCCHSPGPRRQSAECAPGASESWSWSSAAAPGAPVAPQLPSAGGRGRGVKDKRRY